MHIKVNNFINSIKCNFKKTLIIRVTFNMGTFEEKLFKIECRNSFRSLVPHL